MKLKLAYSPCPNDTFIFHAMVHSLVDCEGLSFEVTMADVEKLNQGASRGEYDICKMSYHAYFHFVQSYVMLRSGSALGYNNGPLFVTSDTNSLLKEDGSLDSELLARAISLFPESLPQLPFC